LEKKAEDVDVGKRRGRGEDGGPSAPLKENISPLYIRFNYGIATKLMKNEGQSFTALAPDSKQVGQKEFWGAHGERRSQGADDRDAEGIEGWTKEYAPSRLGSGGASAKKNDFFLLSKCVSRCNVC